MIRSLVLSFVFAASATLHAGEIKGRVVGVSDGDTITVLDDSNASHKIRLHGIDAPEGHQAFGQRSKQALSGKVFDKSVRVATREKDKYGRTIGATSTWAIGGR